MVLPEIETEFLNTHHISIFESLTALNGKFKRVVDEASAHGGIGSSTVVETTSAEASATIHLIVVE